MRFLTFFILLVFFVLALYLMDVYAERPYDRTERRVQGFLDYLELMNERSIET